MELARVVPIRDDPDPEKRFQEYLEILEMPEGPERGRRLRTWWDEARRDTRIIRQVLGL